MTAHVVDVEVAAALSARGIDWPAPLWFAAEIGSTNDALRGVDAAPWTSLRAGRQTGGRGRHGNAWQSPPGNLYLSIALPTTLPQERGPLLSLAAGVALVEALAELGAPDDVRLKWPNDVWWCERKLAGLLLDASSSPRGLESLVLGIGVNVLQAPAATDPPAARLDDLVPVPVAPGDVAAALLARIRDWYDRAANGPPEGVTRAFEERALEWWGRPVRVKQDGRERRGVARGLDARGALLLETADGIEAVLAGDARALRAGE